MMEAERTRRRVLRSQFGALSRRQRRELRKSERRLFSDAYRDEQAERARVAREEKEAWRSRDFLPAGGESGAEALWTPHSFAAPEHRADSGILGLAYPFLADPGLGTKGTMIGRNLLGGSAFVYGPFDLYEARLISDPNIIISGKVGEGKSTLVKVLTSRAAAFGYRSYVPADVKGEWSGPARAIGGSAFEVGPGMLARINPLANPIRRPASISEEEWAITSRNRRAMLLESITERLLNRELGAMERSALGYALEQVERREREEPTLRHVVHELFHTEKDGDGRVPEGFGRMTEVTTHSREIGHALARLTSGALSGVLDQRSQGVQFDPSDPMVSVDVSRLRGSELLDVVMSCTSSWMESALMDGTDSRRFMIYDEGWRVFARPPLLRRMQEHWKVARNWGISNVLVMHGFGDLETAGDGGQASRAMAANLVNDSSTVISFRQSGKAVASAQNMLDLTDTASSLLTRLRKGQSLWRIGQRMSLVQVTRTQREAGIFDTDEAMVSNGAA
ncbi:MAG: ATP-binding protein [Brachybacterium sp.]|uniref:ATP-binding protein n=1 Tax=Brachybacterium sp. TaxID=1891286 RepID=UPI002647FCDC|nr:ATP-binding protein [Brachybacterium sp.]MDN5685835.1 ATP-binding protein [Brachybacterium sp.]